MAMVYANDRAFVSNPATAPDPALVAGMANLLATAPRGARDCLRTQLGTLSGQYSCTAPWYATFGAITASFDSYRLGLGNRGRRSCSTTPWVAWISCCMG